jgi:hydroxyethylthiazole kinase-like uncharacterized protein yjeF
MWRVAGQVNEQIISNKRGQDPVDGFYDGPGSQTLDAAARVGLPIAGIDLMHRAAQAALDVIVSEYPDAARLLVVCGKGNNAGDGYLVAAQAKGQGLDPSVLAIVDPKQLQGDASLAHAMALQVGVAIHLYGGTDLALELTGYDVVVDAMLGTGFSGAVRPAYKIAIEHINSGQLPVVSIDLPSGVDASSGRADIAIKADHTVTFISRKLGTYSGPGKIYSGRMHFADLGVPRRLYLPPSAYSCRWRTQDLVSPAEDAYKHLLGHVLVAGGDFGMPGAIAMASEAALRVGAGMVSIATRPAHGTGLLSRIPEAMTIDPDGDALAHKLDQIDLVVLGPGLGREAWGKSIYRIVEASGKPVVLDADGLYWLAEAQSWQGGDLFMTPHAAEAARLLRITVAAVENDRLACAANLAELYEARVNLKGPGSVVRLSDRTEICRHGNPGMATAGMGDVLSGIVGGLLATATRQRASDEEIDKLFSTAVALHSAAADNAAQIVGMRSLLATDVIRALPTTISGV